MTNNGSDLGDLSLVEIFRMEAEEKCALLDELLLQLEKTPGDRKIIDQLMRTAHSLKGAARIVNLVGIMELAHAMEDVFSAAGRGECGIDRSGFDTLLAASDRLRALGKTAQDADAGQPPDAELQAMIEAVRDLTHAAPPPPPSTAPEVAVAEHPTHDDEPGQPRHLRVDADRMGRLMGLAGELEVTGRRLAGLAPQFWLLKQRQTALARAIEAARDAVGANARQSPLFATLDARLDDCRQLLQELMDGFDRHVRRNTEITGRLRREVLATRLVPFRVITRGIERLVRDLARDLGKEVDLQISGHDTLADRDVLDQLDDCLVHMVRNAVDHGIEPPEDRVAVGKPAKARLTLRASHRGGMLVVELADDGRGLDLETIRRKVMDRKMVGAEVAENLSDRELVEFLFLPGFTTRSQVDAVSGRGVGLDVVHAAIHALRGSVKVHNEPGKGVRFEITVPLSRSVSRGLVVTIDGEPYAIPVASIDRVVRVSQQEIHTVEGKSYIHGENGERIGLVAGSAVLGFGGALPMDETVPVVVFHQEDGWYGMMVERLVGIQDLVVQPLDERLGTIRNVSAGSILEDGSPVLILDPDDLVRSMDRLILQDATSAMTIATEDAAGPAGNGSEQLRILVADDSITVREVEREMLATRGYQVDVAVDGQEAWYLLKSHHYDLLVTDVDMPRMDGIALVERIRADRSLENLPVVIVSYKDRPEDRIRGMEAGADYYLTKGSFEDEKLVQAIRELIGPARKA